DQLPHPGEATLDIGSGSLLRPDPFELTPERFHLLAAEEGVVDVRGDDAPPGDPEAVSMKAAQVPTLAAHRPRPCGKGFFPAEDGCAEGLACLQRHLLIAPFSASRAF